MAAKKARQNRKAGKAKRSARKSPTQKPRETASQSVDQRVIKALTHPLRVEILAILNDRMASPNRLAKELDRSLSQVSYHVKVLNDFEMIELIKTEPRRGSVEHFYRASEKVFIPSWLMKLLPRSAQRGIFGDVLADIEQDVVASLETGTFDKRSDFVVGRDPRILDGKGREEAEHEAARFFERFEEIESESNARRMNGQGDGEEIPTTAVILVFGSALGKKLIRRREQP